MQTAFTKNFEGTYKRPHNIGDLLGALGSRSDGEKRKKREGAHLGFTVDAGDELAHWNRALAMLPGLPGR
jgi:hypothetical protein